MKITIDCMAGIRLYGAVKVMVHARTAPSIIA
jgi:hypothetical protein